MSNIVMYSSLCISQLKTEIYLYGPTKKDGGDYW